MIEEDVSAKHKDKPLTVEIDDNVLVISIGVNKLQHTVDIGRAYGNGDIEITNETEFLGGFVRQLLSEDKDGSTLIHSTFDAAVTEMLENDEPGVISVQ